jgi:O-antigen ligase
MTASLTFARFDRAFFVLAADWLAVAVAIALPWSTSATSIAIMLWLVAVLPTLDPAMLRREFATAAGGLPVLLWGLGAIGMLWASADWSARFGGLDSFHRLLFVPLLLAHFRRSGHGMWVVQGFLISSAAVLAASFLMIMTPGPRWAGHVDGVPVHDDIFQGSEFLICGFGALGVAVFEIRRRIWPLAPLFAVIGALFLADFTVATFSRAVLLVAPLLAALLGWRQLRWTGLLTAAIVIGTIGAGAWIALPNVRSRIGHTIEQFRNIRADGEPTSIAEHIAFLEGSLKIIGAAPIIGHGTGSIPEQFRQIAAGKTGVQGEATVNPHNQTFAVAIQLGLLGAVVLWAMWIAHLLLFRGEGIAAWLGVVIVVENIVSSAVHSHLFDFSHGWLYVFGVGVLGGMNLRERAKLLEEIELPSLAPPNVIR